MQQKINDEQNPIILNRHRISLPDCSCSITSASGTDNSPLKFSGFDVQMNLVCPQACSFCSLKTGVILDCSLSPIPHRQLSNHLVGSTFKICPESDHFSLPLWWAPGSCLHPLSLGGLWCPPSWSSCIPFPHGVLFPQSGRKML